MFKKTPHIKALSNLKNSERKKLLLSCKDQQSTTDYNFPSAVIKQTNYKGQTSVGSIYTNEDNIPIWFKEKHSDLLFPSVYTCWDYPDLLPIIITNTFVVEEKILNGANLMISGTLLPFDTRLVPGALCGIASYKKPKTVMAIGVVQMDIQSYKSVIGETGVAVNVFHYLGDGLSEAFKLTLEPPEESINTEKGPEIIEESDEITLAPAKIEESPSLSVENSTVEEIAEELESFSIDIVDNFITKSLYYSLTNDTTLEFPISSSSFISSHIMRNLPPVDHDMVNLKKSSWKKTAKFLKHFEKEGFIKLKGKNDDLTIVGANKDKPELKNFLPYRTGTSKSSNSFKDKYGDSNDASNMMYSESFYKPITIGKDLVQRSDLPNKALYSTTELKSCITQYISKHNLVDTKNKKMILMDDLMYNLVNKKKNVNAPRLVSRAEVVTPILTNNFNEYFQLYKKQKNGDDIALFKHPMKGAIPKVMIITEMKIGRKVITRVSNFEFFQINAEELAADLRKLCSGSTTIGETLTSPKTTEVQVQGPHSQIIINHLNSLAIPTKWIEFQNKLKPKKKRK